VRACVRNLGVSLKSDSHAAPINFTHPQKKKFDFFFIILLFPISVTFNLILILILTGAGAPQLCRRARTPRKRACATLGAF
jgi:hypothetical protein